MKTSKVTFDPIAHTYTTEDGRTLPGVTPIVAWMYPRTYDGISDEVLAKAAEYGTMVHRACEAADNGIVASDQFVQDYLLLKKDYALTTRFNELIIDNDKVASAIDVVAEDAFGDTWLLDIKTTSQLHNENVRLQLSIYAAIAEDMDIAVNHIAAVWIPKPQYGKPALVEYSRIPADVCDKIIDAYLANDCEERERLFPLLQETLPAEVVNAQRVLAQILKAQKVMDMQKKDLETRLLTLMQEYNVKKWESDIMVITRVLPTTRTTIDTKALKANYPELVKGYEKETTTKESIKITLR